MQSATTTDWTGKKLGSTPYRVLRRLGSGGMAEVYLAEDLHERERVVVKTPHSQFLRRDPSFAARFRQEAQALRRLVHPHIVRILDHSEHEGRPFLVLRFLEGGNLQRRMHSGRHGQQEAQPAEALATWLPEVASALDFMHTQGHLHRDVKPGNVLFDEVGRPYLGDLGLALAYRDHAFGPASQPEARGFGTPRYMAPETLAGSSSDGRADQFSLALIVWEWLTGRCLIPGDTPAQVLTAQQTLLPSLPRWLPDPWMPVFHKALAVAPQQRFVTCHAFAREILDLAQPGFLPSPQEMPTGPATFSLSALDLDTSLEDSDSAPAAAARLLEPEPLPVRRVLPTPPPVPPEEIETIAPRRRFRLVRLTGMLLLLATAAILGSLFLPGTSLHDRLTDFFAPYLPSPRKAAAAAAPVVAPPPGPMAVPGDLPEEWAKKEEVLRAELAAAQREALEAKKAVLAERALRSKEAADEEALRRQIRSLQEEKDKLETALVGGATVRKGVETTLRKDLRDLQEERGRLETELARLQKDLRSRQTSLFNAQEQERRERLRRQQAEDDARQAKNLLDEALRVNLPTLTIRSKLSGTDGFDRVRTTSYFKSFLVPLKAGRTYTIEAKSSDLDTYLRVENAAGVQVAFDDDGGDGLNAKVAYRPTLSGPYRLIVTTYRSRQTGSFVLELKEQ